LATGRGGQRRVRRRSAARKVPFAGVFAGWRRRNRRRGRLPVPGLRAWSDERVTHDQLQDRHTL